MNLSWSSGARAEPKYGSEEFEANDQYHDDGKDEENVAREQALRGLAIVHFPDSEQIA